MPFGFHGLFNFCRVVAADELTALVVHFTPAIARSPQLLQLGRNCLAMWMAWPAAAIFQRISTKPGCEAAACRDRRRQCRGATECRSQRSEAVRQRQTLQELPRRACPQPDGRRRVATGRRASDAGACAISAATSLLQGLSRSARHGARSSPGAFSGRHTLPAPEPDGAAVASTLGGRSRERAGVHNLGLRSPLRTAKPMRSPLIAPRSAEERSCCRVNNLGLALQSVNDVPVPLRRSGAPYCSSEFAQAIGTRARALLDRKSRREAKADWRLKLADGQGQPLFGRSDGNAREKTLIYAEQGLGDAPPRYRRHR
jgi:hypothetical protein